jgi:ribosome-binding factor A
MKNIAPTKRSNRVADLLREEISTMLIRGLRDPRISMVNITGAKITNDLRYAKIYFRVMRETFDLAQVMKGLESAKPFMKKEVGKVLGLRFIPELTFVYDDSLDYGDKMEKIFKKLSTEKKDSAEE